MSAQDELPPGWTWAAGLPASESRGVHVSRGGTFAELAASTWEVWEHRSGITREEYATMRAAVERCAELERLVDDAEHGRATALTVRDAQAERCSKAEAALAEALDERRVIIAQLADTEAQRDEARRELYRALMDMAAGFADITPGAD